MKAITVKQPYASLIFQGKDIENRTWKTNYRGKVLIHAGATFYKGELSDWLTKYQKAVLPFSTLNELTHKHLKDLWETSAIIGEVEIVDCVQNSKSIWAIPGQWHWVIKNPILFYHTIPNVKGSLSIWNVSEDVNQLVIDPYFRTGKISKN